MAETFFTPTGYASLSVGLTSSNVAIPGTPACLLVTNMGPTIVYVVTGASNAVAVTSTTGHPILPGQQVYLAPAAFLAAIQGSFSLFKSFLMISAGS